MSQRANRRPAPIRKDELLGGLPPQWPDSSLRKQIRSHLAQSDGCVVALDDDPTGTQTMHEIWVLTRWEPQDLAWALRQGERSFYILTNSRSLPLCDAKRINREIANNLLLASRQEQRQCTIVSRSDSTLRGHFPGEVESLADTLEREEERAFDAILIIPFFPEGGRYTVNDIHWVLEGGKLIPAGLTPYARDPVFGYRHSALPDWVEEKTGGRVRASDVMSIQIDLLRKGGPDGVARALSGARNRQFVIVNCASYRDLEVFVVGMQTAKEQGKRFLFRTAASFVKVAAGLDDRSLLRHVGVIEAGRPSGGLTVVGSYVPKSTLQLAELQKVSGLMCIEVDAKGVLQDSTRDVIVKNSIRKANQALGGGTDVVLYTSRERIEFSRREENLLAGGIISDSLMDIVRALDHEPRYLIGKGGITASDLATKALQVRAARVLGQIYPGIPVWRLGDESRWPGMPYVVFPGNVGDAHTLASLVRTLRG